jgi:hypothetical protein
VAAKQQSDSNVGKVIEIKGVVLDVVFPGELPQIYNALEIQLGSNGESRTLVAEVQQHLGDDRVRAVAMDATDGLARGVDASTPASRSPSRSATRRSGGSGTCSVSPWTRSLLPPASAGRSTVTRRPSASSRRRSRSSRRGSR